MEPIKAPKTLKLYQLIRQTGMSFINGGLSSSQGHGIGFYSTLQEAEHNRTMELLKDTTSIHTKPKWHVFEIEVPNPTYQE
jgi:hypothetical protein